MLELHHDWDSYCSMKVRLCLAEKGLAWESRRVDLMRFEHLRPDYLALNPNGVVPTLVDDGAAVVESSVINEYLDEVFPQPALRPAEPLARARMRAWVRFQEEVLHPSVRPGTFQLMIKQAIAGLAPAVLDELLAHHPKPERAANWTRTATQPVDREQVAAAKRAMAAALARMEATLAETPWLAGEAYTLADVAAAPFVDRVEHLGFAELWRERPAVAEWIARLQARPAYAAALPPHEQRLPAPRQTSP